MDVVLMFLPDGDTSPSSRPPLRDLTDQQGSPVDPQIYATVEERKQRNRQAQAAFRERRTEYIKQLEEENRRLNTSCQELRQLYSVLSDDFMMCRYKNSFLERILLEHGEWTLPLRPLPKPPRRPRISFFFSKVRAWAAEVQTC